MNAPESDFHLELAAELVHTGPERTPEIQGAEPYHEISRHLGEIRDELMALTGFQKVDYPSAVRPATGEAVSQVETDRRWKGLAEAWTVVAYHSRDSVARREQEAGFAVLFNILINLREQERYLLGRAEEHSPHSVYVLRASAEAAATLGSAGDRKRLRRSMMPVAETLTCNGQRKILPYIEAVEGKDSWPKPETKPIREVERDLIRKGLCAPEFIDPPSSRTRAPKRRGLDLLRKRSRSASAGSPAKNARE